jgi:hypothetical protein
MFKVVVVVKLTTGVGYEAVVVQFDVGFLTSCVEYDLGGKP